MATISVPLNSDLQNVLDGLVAEGVGSNRAEVMRRALEWFAEEEAVNSVLKAEREIAQGKIIRGDAREILMGNQKHKT